MTSKELFEKAMTSWGVEVRRVTDDKFEARRELWYEGRKLEVSWIPEAAQDLTALHGIDGEVELCSFLIDMVMREIVT